MILEKRNRYKLLHKKLVRLRVNPLNNNKFLELILESETKKTIYRKFLGQTIKEEITIRRFAEIEKQKRKKWKAFMRSLVKANKFFQKYKPYTFNSYDVPKIASQGNSFKKKFQKDLFTKKIFNLFYGGFRRKPLKKLMTKIYKTQRMKNPRNLCIELFESRLDSVLKRARLCLSIKDARQLIAHEHIFVNKKIESNYACILKQGDLIQIKYTKSKKSRKLIKTRLNKQFKERFDLIFWPIVPSYLTVHYKTFDIIFGNIKNFDFSTSFNFKNDNALVVESHYRH